VVVPWRCTKRANSGRVREEVARHIEGYARKPVAAGEFDVSFALTLDGIALWSWPFRGASGPDASRPRLPHDMSDLTT
jgi:hypothetical protein